MSARNRVTEKAQHVCGLSVTRCGGRCEARCQVCGARLIRKLRKWTQHYRRGSRYCSNACRQKAYRQRRGGAA